MEITCYAQRLLNPFRGVMNIIECQGAEAVTTDGLHWDIYVRDTDLVEDIANSNKVQTSDIRYGNWSEKKGLTRGAIYPSDDFKVLEHRGAIVYEYLLKHHKEIPFALKDNIELWLLDEDGQPLALLNSVVREEDIDLDCHIDWRAGLECRRHFQSPVMRELQHALCIETGAGEYLTRHINTLAGAIPAAQWFWRNRDGSGKGLAGINLKADLAKRSLPASAFCRYFLKEDMDSPAHRRLIEDFLAWQAPCLLLLQDLSRPVRKRFEQQAASRALGVDKHYRLYPDIMDDALIKAARVEAALRRNVPRDDDEDKVMATYYIELNVTRTN